MVVFCALLIESELPIDFLPVPFSLNYKDFFFLKTLINLDTLFRQCFSGVCASHSDHFQQNSNGKC